MTSVAWVILPDQVFPFRKNFFNEIMCCYNLHIAPFWRMSYHFIADDLESGLKVHYLGFIVKIGRVDLCLLKFVV